MSAIDVTVVVRGLRASGKTTVLNEIIKALKKAGYHVSDIRAQTTIEVIDVKKN